MKYRRIASAVAGSACLCTSLAAIAHPDHEEHRPRQLQAVEVSAAASPDLNQRSVDVERLQRTKASRLDDVFTTEPSVQAGTGSRNGQKLFLRGIEDLNMNVQIDGARQGANLFHHQGRLAIDPLILKSVAVQAGPAPADAGPGALGGSVRFETMDAQDLLRPGQTAGGRLGIEYRSADDSIGGTAAGYGLLDGRIGLLAYVRRVNNDTLRVGGGERVESSDGRIGAYLLKLSLLEQGGHSVWLGAERNTNEGGYLRANFPWQTNNATQALDAQEFSRETVTLRHRYRDDANPLVDVQTTLYTNTSMIELGGATPAGAQRNEDWLTRSTGADIHNTLSFSTGAVRHELKVGADHFEDKGILKDRSLPLSLRLSEKARNTGIYVQDRAVIGPVLISAGLRTDDYRTDYANGYHTSGTETSPNLSAEWRAWGDGRFDFDLFAGYGESIRGGKLNQAGWLKKYFLGPDYRQPRPFTLGDGGKLDAERAIQRQWGMRWHGKGLWQAQDHAGVELSLFSTRVRDYQVVPGEGANGVTDRIYNAPGDITSKGYELRAHWGTSQWLVNAAYSHTKLRNYDGQPMDTSGDSARVGVSTGDRFVLDASWQANSEWQFGYTLVAVRHLKDVPANRPEKPGYSTHAIQAVWKPVRFQENLTLILGIDNLLDRRYAEHTSVRVLQTANTGSAVAGQEYSSPEAGRNVRVAVDWQF